MTFLERIESFDHQLLMLVNGANSPFLDDFMWIVSSKLFGIPFYLIFLYILFKNKPIKQLLICVLLLIVAVGLADLTAKYCFKEVFERYRPSHNLALKDQLHFVLNANGLPYIGGKFGFVSSHACNMFALTFLFYRFIKEKYPKAIWLLLFLVLLIIYSRVYLGVHYPSDVIAGGVIGVFIAQFLYYLSLEFKWVK